MISSLHVYVRDERNMNVSKAFLQLTYANIRKIPRQGTGMYQMKDYPRCNLCLSYNRVFYYDENETVENRSLLDPF